jgi:hypothetical protein
MGCGNYTLNSDNSDLWLPHVTTEDMLWGLTQVEHDIKDTFKNYRSTHEYLVLSFAQAE